MKNYTSWRKHVVGLVGVQVVCLFMLAAGVGAETQPTSKATDWPHWRGPTRDGISTETGWLGDWPEKGPKLLWRSAVGTGFSSMAVSSGRVYTMGNTGKKGKADDEDEKDIVYCLAADTGKVIWKHEYACALKPKYYEGGTHATPTVDGKRVYTFSKQGHVFCLDAASGAVVWSRDVQKQEGLAPPTWGFAGSPTVMGDLVILNAGSAGVALKKATGETVWKSGSKGAGYATPMPFKIGERECVALFSGKALAALDPASGKELWRFVWRTEYDCNAADPIFVDKKVFISSGYNTGCALLEFSESGCAQLWRHKHMSNHCNSSVLWEGFLYGFDGNVNGKGVFRCLDLADGKVKWSQSGLGAGSLMLAEGKLIILSESGELVIAPATPQEFKPLQRAQILQGRCWTVPVLSDGKIYARNAVGELVCVDVRGS